MLRVPLPVLVALALACGGSPPGPSEPASPPAADAPSPLADEARAGVSDRALAELLVRHWDGQMRRAPVWATTLGDHRFDDRLARDAHADVLARRQERAALLAEARALAGRADLDASDRTTLELLVGELEAETAAEVCESHLWAVSAQSNAVTELNVLPERHTLTTPASGAALLSRYRDMPRLVDEQIANLRRGAAAGLVGNAESLRRTIALVEGQLATPLESWALVRPAAAVRDLEGWTDGERRSFAAELTGLVEREVRPALERYLAALRELVPAGRSGDRVGLHALPSGEACYAARIRAFTGLERSAESLHQLGRQEIARIEGEMRALGASLFGTSELPAIRERLRTDRSLYFEDADAILETAEAALARARAAIPEHFGLLPEAECVVVPIPAYEAPYTTIAYYSGPHPDGSKPGEYFVNTYKPEVRPRFEMEVLAYHESIPGHHLQIAIAQELGALPAFRRFGGSTAFIEGWGLYAERLADDMGLYSGELDRMGMLSYDAWRAARLVVDTGLHAQGWTREEAETYMREHTLLTDENIRNEVDRYLAWPGQALAYKVGQLEILRLRELARERLGARFSLPRFHDAVLGQGAVSLPVLRRQVEAWAAAP